MSHAPSLVRKADGNIGYGEDRFAVLSGREIVDEVTVLDRAGLLAALAPVARTGVLQVRLGAEIDLAGQDIYCRAVGTGGVLLEGGRLRNGRVQFMEALGYVGARGVAFGPGGGVSCEREGEHFYQACTFRDSHIALSEGHGSPDPSGRRVAVLGCRFDGAEVNSAFLGGEEVVVWESHFLPTRGDSHNLRIWGGGVALVGNSKIEPGGRTRHSLKGHSQFGVTKRFVLSGCSFQGGTWNVAIGPQDLWKAEIIESVTIVGCIFLPDARATGDSDIALRVTTTKGGRISGNVFQSGPHDAVGLMSAAMPMVPPPAGVELRSEANQFLVAADRPYRMGCQWVETGAMPLVSDRNRKWAAADVGGPVRGLGVKDSGTDVDSPWV